MPDFSPEPDDDDPLWDEPFTPEDAACFRDQRDRAHAELNRLREALTEIRGLSMPNLLAEIAMYGKPIGDWDVVDQVAREALDPASVCCGECGEDDACAGCCDCPSAQKGGAS